EKGNPTSTRGPTVYRRASDRLPKLPSTASVNGIPPFAPTESDCACKAKPNTRMAIGVLPIGFTGRTTTHPRCAVRRCWTFLKVHCTYRFGPWWGGPPGPRATPGRPSGANGILLDVAPDSLQLALVADQMI